MDRTRRAGRMAFRQRLWRLIGEADRDCQSAPISAACDFGAPALTMRKACARRAGEGVGRDREAAFQRLRRAHLRVRQCALLALSDNRAPTPDFAWAMREAAGILVRLFHPMMPHLAEECWAALGHDTLVASQAWPAVEPGLLVENTITLPVQINGKKRADVTVPRDATKCRDRGCRPGAGCGTKGSGGQTPEKGHCRPAKDRQCGGLSRRRRYASFPASPSCWRSPASLAGCFQPLYGDRTSLAAGHAEPASQRPSTSSPSRRERHAGAPGSRSNCTTT